MLLVAESLFIEAESSKDGLTPDGGTKAFGDSGFPGFLIKTQSQKLCSISLVKTKVFWGAHIMGESPYLPTIMGKNGILSDFSSAKIAVSSARQIRCPCVVKEKGNILTSAKKLGTQGGCGMSSQERPM